MGNYNSNGVKWSEIRKIVLERDHQICQYCGAPCKEVDHIIPLSRNGPTQLDNLVAACAKCNLAGNVHLFRSFTDKKKFILWRRGMAEYDQSIVEIPKERVYYRKEKVTITTCYITLEETLKKRKGSPPPWHEKVYGWGKHKKK